MVATSSEATRPDGHGATGTDSLTWRLLVDGLAAGTRNMALDHALAACLGQGQAVLRFYAWERPTVSFGRNEPAALLYDRVAGAADGLDFVRRPTGGRAVLHDREVTYAVVVPLRAFGGVRAAYRRINRGLVDGLTNLGVPARLSDDGVVTALDSGPCFQTPAPGEVVAGGRKLVGSAQARVDGALLQHGSVILEGDQRRLSALADDGRVWEGPATVAAMLPSGSVQPGGVVSALAEACRLAWGGRWTDAPCTRRERETADRLEAERYARPEWTWRR